MHFRNIHLLLKRRVGCRRPKRSLLTSGFTIQLKCVLNFGCDIVVGRAATRWDYCIIKNRIEGLIGNPNVNYRQGNVNHAKRRINLRKAPPINIIVLKTARFPCMGLVELSINTICVRSPHILNLKLNGLR